MSKKFSHIGQAFSQLGQAFMLPIAILPVAGLLLGLGGALTNKAAVGAYPWLNQEWLQTILKVMNFAGSAVFNNLALIFSIGLAVGLAKGDKGTAGLAGGVAYLVYTATISGLLQLFSPKNTIDTGVLGAIVIGSVVAYLHNHYRKVELPQFLGFFGGSRFIPIISSLAAIIIGAIFFIIWPPIQSGLTSAGFMVSLTLIVTILLKNILAGASVIAIFLVMLVIFNQVYLYPVNHWFANFMPVRMTNFWHFYVGNELYRICGFSISCMRWSIVISLTLSVIFLVSSFTVLYANRKKGLI